MKFSTLSTALLGAGVASALSPVTISGNKFFDSNGNQFFLKGMPHLANSCFLLLLWLPKYTDFFAQALLIN